MECNGWWCSQDYGGYKRSDNCYGRVVIGVVAVAGVMLGRWRAFLTSWKVLLLGKETGVGLIIKLWLRFRSRHLVLWLLRIYGLRKSG
jgi:hypothetical protein